MLGHALVSFLGKLCGRTFGVQSLRGVAVSCVSALWLQGAGAGGVAVALTVKKRIIPFGGINNPINSYFRALLSARDWAISSRKRASTAGSDEALAARSEISVSRFLRLSWVRMP